MIRLKLLLEDNNSPTDQTINVLFIGDEDLYKPWAFNHKLEKAGIVVGEDKIFKIQANSERLLDSLEYNINDTYDLAVLYCKGREEKSAYTTIENLEIAIQEANKVNVPIVLNTFPTLKFTKLKDDELDDRQNMYDDINMWIRQSGADFVIDVNRVMNSDIYFDKDGINLSSQGHSKAAKILLAYIQKHFDVNQKNVSKLLDSDDDRKNKTNSSIVDVQKQLVDLGYHINPEEIDSGTIGSTTKQALKRFQKKFNLISTGTITTKTLSKLNIIKQQQSTMISSDSESELSKVQPGKWKNIMKFFIDNGLSVAGAAGIAGNMRVESNFNPGAIGDNGTSYGLVQWHASNKTALFNHAKSIGKPVNDIDMQLEYLWDELTSKFRSLVSFLKSTTDPRKAAEQFAKNFERPAVISEKRMDYAEQYANSYDNSNSSSADPTNDPTNDTDNSSMWGKVVKYFTGGITSAIAAKGLTSNQTYGFPTGDVNSGKVVSGGIDGDWAGSMARALEVANVAKEFVGKNIISSQKRSKVKTNSGNVSDHWEGSEDAYAVDLSTGTPNEENYKHGDELFAHLMDWMGHPEYKPGKWININKGGYRYQFGWRTPEGDHENHIHVGVKKL
jgi:peptidoglycan hydrolase-like protein with peptidoglycan-binding domain